MAILGSFSGAALHSTAERKLHRLATQLNMRLDHFDQEALKAHIVANNPSDNDLKKELENLHSSFLLKNKS